VPGSREKLVFFSFTHHLAPMRFRLCILCLVMLLMFLGPGATVLSCDEIALPQPSARIGLLPLGYIGLSAGARQSGASNLSVDFLDSHHVLLTFNPKRLFKRSPDCPITHADRLIHAVVLEVPSGKVVKEADWYVHDLRRYAWNLGSGRLLLRRLNRLYEVNTNLEEKLIFDSSKELLWVTVTADGKQIIIETSAGTATAHDSGDANPANDAKKERVHLTFLDANTLLPQRTIDVRGRIKLEATSSGFGDVRRQGGNWLVAFNNTNITRVKSRPVPDLLYTSANTLLIGRCSVSRPGYNVSAFSITGTFLWRQHWEQCRYSTLVRNGEDGSRFAAGSVALRPRTNSDASTPTEFGKEGLLQHVQVLDTATGNPVLSLSFPSASLDGQNFSLSPDGNILAVVAGENLDLYNLPEMSPQDRAQFVAVKADTPNLNVPPAQASKPAEPVYSAAADTEGSDVQPANDSPSPAPAAESPKPADEKEDPTPTLTIRTGTQVVAVDVVVTDSAGHLVKGLQQSDFHVAEDGKPQNLRYFSEVLESDRKPPAPVPVKEVLPPNVFSNSATPPEEGAVTVVLLDLLNTPMADQAYAQDQLIKFLQSKPQGAKIAICILGNRLQMIQGFTADQATLLAAAKGKKASQRNQPLWRSDAATQASLQGNRASTRFQPTLDSFAASLALQQSELRLVEADQRMEVTVDAFAHLARYLTGIPGRKNLVWLSGSFVLGIYPDSNGQNPFLGTRHYGENLKKVANLLGEAHVAVYPVDVKGLDTNPLFSAANNDTSSPFSTQGSFRSRTGPAQRAVPGSAVLSTNPNTATPGDVMGDEIAQFGLAQTDEHATMTELAAQTGGKAFYNNNGIAQAIQTASEQGANYYALSYTPANKKYDGAYRRVKVTLPGKKYHLAYREGYYAINPFAPVRPSKDLTSSLARAAMQAGSPQSRQITFGVRVVPLGPPRVVQDSAADVKSTKKRKDPLPPPEVQRYAIDHAVSSTDLRYAQAADGVYQDMLNFMVTAFDQEGNLLASQIAQTESNLKPEAFKEVLAGGLRMHQEIEVPTKCVSMRLGVEDVSNGHIGTLEVPLPVPPPPEVKQSSRRSLPPVEPD
jgi:VWFA-related protein